MGFLQVKYEGIPFSTGILLSVWLLGFLEGTNFLNIYSHYHSKEQFWNNIELKGTFKLQNMLISRDLNFTWSTNEFWGQRDKLDPLSSFFFGLFEKAESVDVEPIPISPTWRNG